MKLIVTIAIIVCCMVVGVSLMFGNHDHRDCFLSHIEPCAR
jgi:hypothetical protein